MSKLLPLLMLLIGLGAGAGTGYVLRPPAGSGQGGAAHGDAATVAPEGEDAVADAPRAVVDPRAAADALGHYAPAPNDTETIRLPNQFVVPLIQDGRVQAMVVIGLALELQIGHGFELARHEPRLRAVFLQLLFDHANIGGFTGLFTSGETLLALRRILRDAARAEIGSHVHDVLITELMRQES
jgi:flagellar protein FliL